MSDLVPASLMLTYGLDLTAPKPAAAPGTLLDCLNYEIVDYAGLRRIDGFERYDGKVGPSKDTWFTILVPDSYDISTLASGDLLTRFEDALGGFNPKPFGVVVDIDTASHEGFVYVHYIRINVDLEPAPGVLFREFGTIASFEATQIVDGQTLMPSDADASTALGNLNDYYTTLAARIGPLPFPAAGLHWFRDRLYAVVDNAVMTVTTTSGSPLVVGDYIGQTTGFQGRVLKNVTSSGVRYITYQTLAGTPDTTQPISRYTDHTFTTTAGWVGGITNASVDVSFRDSASIWVAFNERQAQVSALTANNPNNAGWVPLDEPIFSIGFDNGSDAIFNWVIPDPGTDTLQAIYFSNGATVLSAEFLGYRLNSGSFAAGTAAGTVYYTKLRLFSGTSNFSITGAWNITDDTGVTVYAGISSISGSIYEGLPSIQELIDNSSRYEFMTANFYANEEWDAFYGVSGAGRAFWHDGYFLRFIEAIPDSEDLDKPRHLAYHLGHLALGYKEGSVLMSVAGEPTNFSGVDGASEHGIGDRVVGLMTLNGDTLGVWCESSIRSIVGSTVASFSMQTIAPHIGCIEYSLCNIGVPVYCTPGGIYTLAQSERYGDFMGTPLSAKIGPWIKPRMRRGANFFSLANGAGISCAIPVRSKNHYRLYFRDGRILTMTLNGEGSPPEFTFQRYRLGYDEMASDAVNDMKFLVPFAFSSQIDEDGFERVHFSHYSPLSTVASSYVYEMEKGWFFDDSPIDSLFETNWVFKDRPDMFFTIRKVRLHGLSRGIAQLRLRVQGIENAYEANYSAKKYVIDLPRSPFPLLTADPEATSNITHADVRGLGVTFRMESLPGISEPYHVCQILMIQAANGGMQDS